MKNKTKKAISLIEKNIKDLVENARELTNLPIEIIEWRADFFNEILDEKAFNFALKSIKNVIGNKISLLFTLRTKNEGGFFNFDFNDYFLVNQRAINSNQIDLIDFQFLTNKKNLQFLLNLAKKNQVKTVISFHDFEKTKKTQEIYNFLLEMISFEADFYKVAYFANSPKDPLNLLLAAIEFTENFGKKVIPISMGNLGLPSRILSDFFHFPICFAANENQKSAPGQIPISDLVQIFDLIDKNR